MYFVYVEYNSSSDIEIDEVIFRVLNAVRENQYSEGCYERNDYYDVYGFLKLETAKEFIERVKRLNRDEIEKIELMKCNNCGVNLATRFVKFSEIRKEFLCEECYQSLI